MPGATFQRLASEWLKSVTAMVNMPWDEVMKKYVRIDYLSWSLSFDLYARKMGYLADAILVRCSTKTAVRVVIHKSCHLSRKLRQLSMRVRLFRRRSVPLAFDPVISAGADSASSVMSSFVLAMTLRPEIFLEAQAEIDSVIGRERLPELSDREKLPFLECVIKEVYRWNPPAPIGAAHRLMEDDFYNGYLIPKGKIFANQGRAACSPTTLI